MGAKACIVTTLRGVSANIIQTFVEYHLNIGFQHIYLFYDEFEELHEHNALHDEVTTIGNNAELKYLWKQARSFDKYKEYIEKEVMARQILNVEVAIKFAISSGYDWILHIDIDELFVIEQNISVADHFKKLENNGISVVHYLNHESIPESIWIDNYFEKVTLFKKNAQALNKFQKETLQKMDYFSRSNYFKFYRNGKSAAKLHNNLTPQSVHHFRGEFTRYDTDKAFVLHYPCCGLNHFSSKYNILGDFSDKWFTQDDIAQKLPVHLLSRDIILTDDQKLAERFYRLIFLDQGRNQTTQLIECGIFFRIEPLKTIANV